MKRKVLLPLLSASILLGGCNLFPEPAALIQPPKIGSDEGPADENLLHVVKGFLPKGTSLFVPNEPAGMDSFIKEDLNNDGLEEVIAFYKSQIQADNTGAIVLRQKDGKWIQEKNISGNGYEVSWGGTADFTGDGKPELMVGWKVGVSPGSILDIYKWENGKFIKLAQQNYHKLDVIYEDDIPRLAVWKRVSDDIYDISVLKWGTSSFTPDQDLSPAYFAEAADYYKQRAEEVPDAAKYWYSFADTLLMANQPESALEALTTGMNLDTSVPGWEQFQELQGKIEKAIYKTRDSDVQYYDKHAGLTMNFPRELAGSLAVETQQGSMNNYILNVYVADETKKGLLFAIEVFSKEFMTESDLPFPVIAETDQLVYMVRRNSENPFIEEPESDLNKLFTQSIGVMEEIISSIRLGSPYSPYESVKETLLMQKIQDGAKKASYVGIGGAMESGEIQSFPLNGNDYRYMGTDLDTAEKLEDYLSSSFTEEAIQSFVKTSRIAEHEGKLAQPNADGGSLLNYRGASIAKVKDYGTELQYDIQVPIGGSLAFETIQVIFKKTEAGWRISTNPVTL